MRATTDAASSCCVDRLPDMARLTSSPGRTIPVLAINAGALAILVVWLVVAAYAFAYLVSH